MLGVISCMVMKILKEIQSLMHRNLFKVEKHLHFVRLSVAFWYLCDAGNDRAILYAKLCLINGVQFEDAMKLLEKVQLLFFKDQIMNI